MNEIAEQAALIGRFRLALDWADTANKLLPSAEAYRVRGIALFELGHRQQARECWQQALRLDPNHIETLQTSGLTYLLAGDLAAARSDFLRVLAIEPANKAARFHMAQTYDAASIAQGKEREATQLNAQKVVEYTEPMLSDEEFIGRHPGALYITGVAQARLGHFQEAETLLRRFVAMKPKDQKGQRMLESVLTILDKPR
jgi:tetratricopeptide (TPR) repeat protein